MKKILFIALAIMSMTFLMAEVYQITVHVQGYEYVGCTNGTVTAKFGNASPGDAQNYMGNGSYDIPGCQMMGSPSTVTGIVTIGSRVFTGTAQNNAPQTTHVYVTIPNPFNQSEEEDPTIPPNQ
jgi:hypothetical protein